MIQVLGSLASISGLILAVYVLWRERRLEHREDVLEAREDKLEKNS